MGGSDQFKCCVGLICLIFDYLATLVVAQVCDVSNGSVIYEG